MMRIGRSKNRHNRIADILVKDPPVFEEDFYEQAEAFIEKIGVRTVTVITRLLAVLTTEVIVMIFVVGDS